jgi:hypothetical protein
MAIELNLPFQAVQDDSGSGAFPFFLVNPFRCRVQKNSVAHTACGHGGVPIMAFREEPFFGEDRFDMFFWTLQRNGLTRKKGNAPLPESSWTA